MDEQDKDWEKLLKAAKPALEKTEPPSGELQARFPKLREAVHAISLAMTWKKFSLVAVLVAVVLLLVILLRSEQAEQSPTLIVPEPPFKVTEP
jgi:hypothetical protein